MQATSREDNTFITNLDKPSHKLVCLNMEYRNFTEYCFSVESIFLRMGKLRKGITLNPE